MFSLALAHVDWQMLCSSCVVMSARQKRGGGDAAEVLCASVCARVLVCVSHQTSRDDSLSFV